MALTLLDYQRLKKDNFEKGVIETWMQECDISKMLPIENIGTVEIRTRRSNSIPTVGFRTRGQAYGSISGTTRDIVADAVFPMGGNIDVDKMDMRDKSPIEDPLATRTEDAVRGMAWTFNEKFINGDHGTSLDEFEGLKVRLAIGPSAQTLYGVDSSTKLDIRAAILANTTAPLQTLFDRFDATIYQLDGHGKGGNVAILTDATNIFAIGAAKRRLSIYKDTDPADPAAIGSVVRANGNTPAQGPVETYRGIPIYDMGLKADQSTHIIGTETINSVACYPFYFVKMGSPRYLHGIEEYPIEISKSFMTDDGVTYRTVIDWPVGLRHTHPKFAAVLKGVFC